MTATREWSGLQVVDPIVRDEVLTVGSDGRLVGIVSHPATGQSRVLRTTVALGQRDPGLILLNAGVLHRIGPHRLHVVLARRMATHGISALRLDLGGIGDSVAAPGAASFRESAVADTRTAMTALTDTFGIRSFFLFGICAGADNAIATALVDERVAGIVLVDPPSYATRRGQLRDLRDRVAKRGGPRDVLRWGLQVAERRLRRAIARLGRHEPPASGGRELPTAAAYRAQLTQLVERRVRILAVYSGIHRARYNRADQLFELYPELRDRIDVAYFADANHTFTERTTQAALVDTLTRWIAKHRG